jgi:hypothetical protein
MAGAPGEFTEWSWWRPIDFATFHVKLFHVMQKNELEKLEKASPESTAACSLEVAQNLQNLGLNSLVNDF